MLTPLQKLQQWHYEQNQKREQLLKKQQATIIKNKTTHTHTNLCIRGKKGRKYENGKCNICGGRPNMMSYVDDNGDKFTWYDNCISIGK